MSASNQTATSLSKDDPIRPVCRRFPTSQQVWEATNLPFACVLTPLARQQRDAAKSINAPAAAAAAISSIPKCLHCGAPHANKETHFLSQVSYSGSNNDSSFLLCYLCGKTSPTSWKLQQEHRQADQDESVSLLPVDDDPSNATATTRTAQRDQDSFLFELPLRFVSASRQQQQQSSSVQSIPAISCPPLWFIVLDGSCTHSAYWQAASRALTKALHDVPAHIHVSLLIAGNSRTSMNAAAASGNNDDDNNNNHSMSIFQLTSPVPHLLRYHDNNNDDGDSQNCFNIRDAIANSLTDGMHRSHLQTAIRSLMDYNTATNDSSFLTNGEYDTPHPSASTEGMPLGWAVELILDALQSHGQAAGQRVDSHGDGSNTAQRLPYAGAKLTCLLSQRPGGICGPSRQAPVLSTGLLSAFGRQQQREQHQYTPVIGKGGFGGRIADSGKPHSAAKWENGVSSDLPSSDMTPGELESHYQPAADVTLYMDELGRQCAQAAMGVDLLFMLDQPDGDAHDDDQQLDEGRLDSLDLALPLYGHLSGKSGAPGPLLFNVNSPPSMDRLDRELASRVPWRDGMVFGAELRLRLPPGFAVDNVAIESSDEKGPQLAPLWVDAGLMGPASSVDDSKQLWRMGTCDAFTSFTIDLCLKEATAPREFSVPELGTVAIKPVIQTCFAYTTTEEDKAGNYVVKRQMRIHSYPVPIACDTETLYNTLDTETLLVVLFHKVAIASLQDGLLEGLHIAEDWLISSLVSVYRSAEEHFERMGTGSMTYCNGSRGQEFLAHERLLDQEGELSTDDLLLAQGHFSLRCIVLMAYQLLQCDAFRPARAEFCPSRESRYAALYQLASMPPHILSRCVGPLIQAWLSTADATEPVVDSVELRRKSIRMTTDEFSKYDDVLFFLDSPSMVAVLDGRLIEEDQDSLRNAPQLAVSDALQQLVDKACLSYRAKPDVIDQLKGEDNYSAMEILTNVLIRDMASPAGHANYTKWKKDIAARVLE